MMASSCGLSFAHDIATHTHTASVSISHSGLKFRPQVQAWLLVQWSTSLVVLYSCCVYTFRCYYVLLQDFGLDKEGFHQLIKDCPPSFYHLATECCHLDPDKRLAHTCTHACTRTHTYTHTHTHTHTHTLCMLILVHDNCRPLWGKPERANHCMI